jgi:hypothetical protein
VFQLRAAGADDPEKAASHPLKGRSEKKMTNAKTDEWLEFERYLSPESKEAKKYAGMTLAQLFEQASKDIKVTLEVNEEGTPDEWAEEKIDLSSAGVLYEIYRRLDIVDGDTMIAYVKQELGDLQTRVKDLESQFKNHRHCLGKTYGEKPVY